MMQKGDLAEDPRGLIYEAYRIEGVTGPDCRTIFLDWALGHGVGADQGPALETLLAHYGPQFPDHPMTQVLREGLTTAAKPARRGGHRARPRG